MLAERSHEGFVEQVRGCVVSADGVSARSVDSCGDALALFEETARHHAAVNDEVGDRIDCILYRKRRIGGCNDASVADLAAFFAVERRLREHDVGLLSSRDGTLKLAIRDNGQDLSLCFVLIVAAERRRGKLVGQFSVNCLRDDAAGLLARGSCALALLIHGRLKTFVVNLDAALVADLLR